MCHIKIMINKHRHVATKLKVSLHNLAVKTGRHDGIDRNYRKCTHCSVNVIENEY